MSQDETAAGERPRRPAPQRRRAVTLTTDALVHEEPLDAARSSALLLSPAAGQLDLVEWAASNRESLRSRLLAHGALLLRGFDVGTVGRFEQFVSAVSPSGPLEYRERSSPRSRVVNNVYTSTDYPADQRIFFHNENSYAAAWPMKLFFHCVKAAESGGETPIADSRRVYARLTPQTRARFEERGVMYVRNFGDGFGLTWQTVFQTEDRGEVDEACKRSGVRAEWKDGGRLRTRAVRPAIVRHPQTGETVWFNHAAFFHVTTLGEKVTAALLAELGEQDLPNNTYYGDGSPIEPETLEEIRDAYESEKVAFGWRQGDVLVVENMLTAHSREPFRGERKIVVAMSEPRTWQEL